MLLGSCVVETPSGPSPPLHLRFSNVGAIEALIHNFLIDLIDIKNGKCYVGVEEWGRPCSVSEGAVNITLNDVSKQKELRKLNKGSTFTKIFFVPRCEFEKPEEDMPSQAELSPSTLAAACIFTRGTNLRQLNGLLPTKCFSVLASTGRGAEICENCEFYCG
ncbi:unnamed protein product [Hydatigera taeniaeformis]|uniref:DUF5727 domain-containing protein n=1 Tax=Hydatigena taeniaeformis TaxID=6205 RepID=A0A3P7FI12_HYDTA|nr:unnamed protein product [Hydatigera taeniaeformis]